MYCIHPENFWEKSQNWSGKLSGFQYAIFSILNTQYSILSL